MAQQMGKPEPCQQQHMHSTVLPGLAGSAHSVHEECAAAELWGCPIDGHATNAWHTTQNCVGSSPDTVMIY